MSATDGCQTKTSTAWRATKGVITNEQELFLENSESLRFERFEYSYLLLEKNKEKMRRQSPKTAVSQCTMCAIR